MKKDFRPLPQIIGVYCEYYKIPYRFRQRMSLIQHYMIKLRNLSKVNYKLHFFEDGFCLLNPLTNKILWTLKNDTSWCIALNRLEEINRYYYYEKDFANIKNVIQRNDYLTLRQKYE